MQKPRRAPLRTRLAVAAGSLLLLPALAAAPAVAGHAEIDGPLNVLLAGIDPRGSHQAPLADTIVVLHVPANRQGAYLFSLPRDLVVRIPAFPASGSTAQRGKINAAMRLGAQAGAGRYDPAQGLRLLATTVGRVTGIAAFDASAVIDFGGFKNVVAALGGVSMVIDQRVVSEHRKPDGSPRDRLRQCRGHQNCARPYTGPQKVYRPSSTPVRLRPWEALDYVRQRYGLPRSDYDRQRHQRQFLTAVAGQLHGAGAARMRSVLGAAGGALRFNGGRHSLAEWVAELREIEVAAVTTVGLPGRPVFERGKYLGERLDAAGFFAAVVNDRVAAFLLDHPGAVTLDR
ncbi:LCP family protein [Actinoplanes sp. NPDC023936]|uniref:LCP family protein n=1 Tax=Actinoplanes sp. NPDC023936 TaxID=3154910 RepID=UPI0033F46228